MTRDEILVLSAGPDLDAELARLLGYTVYTQDGFTSRHLREPKYPCVVFCDDGWGDYKPNWNYADRVYPWSPSRRWEQAGELLEAMLDDCVWVAMYSWGRCLQIRYGQGREATIVAIGKCEAIAKAYCIWRLGVES